MSAPEVAGDGGGVRLGARDAALGVEGSVTTLDAAR